MVMKAPIEACTPHREQSSYAHQELVIGMRFFTSWTTYLVLSELQYMLNRINCLMFDQEVSECACDAQLRKVVALMG